MVKAHCAAEQRANHPPCGHDNAVTGLWSLMDYFADRHGKHAFFFWHLFGMRTDRCRKLPLMPEHSIYFVRVACTVPEIYCMETDAVEWGIYAG